MRTKNRMFFLMVMLFALAGLLLSSTVGHASAGNAINSMQDAPPTPTPLPHVSSYKNQASFTFKEMGIEETTLPYPSEAKFDMNMPDYWEIAGDIPNTYLDINYDMAESYSFDTGRLQEERIFTNYGFLETTLRPMVEIYINDTFVGSFHPEVGEDLHARVELPSRLFVDNKYYNPDMLFEVAIGFYRDNSYYCGYDGILTILDTSVAGFTFLVEPVERDLSTYSRALVQSSFIPESLYIILPDEFDDNTLTAAATLVDYLGVAALGNADIKTIRASDVTPSMLQISSAVVIGVPEEHKFIKGLLTKGLLPVNHSADGTILKNTAPLPPEYGVVELLPSDVNSTYSYLVVSGNSSEGVLFAAKELAKSSATLRYNYHIFEPITKQTPVAEDQKEAAARTPADRYEYVLTFDDAGIGSPVLRGLGRQDVGLSFYIPRNWKVQDGAKVVVNYAASEALSQYNSIINVLLNGIPIGSITLKGNTGGEMEVEILIDPAKVIPGSVNFLNFSSVQLSDIECAQINRDVYWVTFFEESKVSLPYRIVESEREIYPIVHPFFYLANERDLLVIVPEDPTTDELDAVLTYIARFGEIKVTTGPQNIVMTQDPDAVESYPGHNILAYGRPSRNEFVVSINNQLPQQFVPGEDILRQGVSNIEIRTPSDTDIGLVQAVEIEEYPAKGMTVFTGTSEEGMQYILDATTSYFGTELVAFDGNLIYFGKGYKVLAYQSSFIEENMDMIITEVVQEPVQVVTAAPTATSAALTQADLDADLANVSEKRLSINTGALFVIIGLGILVIVFGAVQLLNRRIIRK